MALAAYDLSQPGSSTLSAPFCVMTSLPHCNRNAGSCTDGYTTAKVSKLCGEIRMPRVFAELESRQK